MSVDGVPGLNVCMFFVFMLILVQVIGSTSWNCNKNNDFKTVTWLFDQKYSDLAIPRTEHASVDRNDQIRLMS